MTSLTPGVRSSSCLTTHHVRAAESINAKLTATMGTHSMLSITEITWHRPSRTALICPTSRLINENFGAWTALMLGLSRSP